VVCKSSRRMTGNDTARFDSVYQTLGYLSLSINGLALVTVQETQRRSGTRTLGASNTIPITPNLKEYHATSTNATPPAMPPPTPNPPQIQINQCPKLIMA